MVYVGGDEYHRPTRLSSHDPPAKALVLCCDEKSQCQALERTQLGLPLSPGHGRTRTHDYIRHDEDPLVRQSACSLLGATTDIHLVIYGEGNGVVAKLVSTERRFLLQKGTTVSVPLAALTATMVDTLAVFFNV